MLLPVWNAVQARELFVENVLLAELGEDLSSDPAFRDLVRRVSEHLESEPRINQRLDGLLRELAGHD